MTIYKDDLERVYALIEKPENWTRGAFALTATGKVIGPCEEHACRWCIEGAFRKVVGSGGGTLCDLDRALGVYQSSHFNDHHTHAEVLDLLRKAIERAPVRP